MRKIDFPPIFEKLTIAYGGRLQNNPEILDVFFLILKDLPTALVRAAALDYMASPAAFPPSPGEIRACAINLQKRGSGLPSTAEAWQMVMAAPADGIVSWSEERDDGWHIFTKRYQWESPIVEKVARNLGWPDRFLTDSPVSDRARFMDAYQLEIDRATGEATSLPAVRAYLAEGPAEMNELLDGVKKAMSEKRTQQP